MNRLRSRSALPAQLWPEVPSELDALPDAELLARFAGYNDAPAFEALVRRHGPLVYGVCRRVLHGTDPDDAFQAAFLVLVRKARTLHRTDRLGPWLYGVAFRVALKARTRGPRSVPLPPGAADMIPDPAPAVEPADWLPILDAELSALPAKYREPLVLCELQGASRAAAAKKLGLREGTLSSRLARGRVFLRERLLKHGTLLSAGGLAALLGTGGTGGASAPGALVTRVCEFGATPAGAVPVGAARLADEVLKAMFVSKLRAAGAALVLALVAVGLAAAAMPEGEPQPPPADKPAAKAAQPQPDASPKPDAKLTDRDAAQGLWVLSKYEPEPDPKFTPPDPNKIGKVRLLVSGDVWWLLGTDEGSVRPWFAVLTETKNPKWLDWHNGAKAPQPDFKLIYLLTGDELKVCSTRMNGERPAEFLTGSDVPTEILTFRRDKQQPGAGAKELLGWWGGRSTREAEGGSQGLVADVRAEVIGDLLFVCSDNEHWFGGRYTVDTTKNPHWIDIELIAPLPDKSAKLYGSYEVTDGKLRLAFGTKRATRPLEFTGDGSTYIHLTRPGAQPKRK
jgi:RNA polymerase sigma factor (sigma-70 family)